MRDLEFLNATFNHLTFVMLSGKEIAALTPDQLAKYNALLAEFVTWFQATYPKGYDMELDVKAFGNPYNGKNSKGQAVMKAALELYTEDEPAWVADLLTMQISQLDILAKSAGYPAYMVMKFVSAAHLDKGTLKANLELLVAGETITARGGKQITIKKTHLRHDDFVITLSPSMRAAQAKAVNKAAEDAFSKMFEFGTSVQGSTETNQEPVGEQDDAVNP